MATQLTAEIGWKGTILTIRIPNGSTIAFASGYNAADTVTVVTNANPAVATTSVAHGVTTGEFLEVTSGWTRLTGRILRAAAAAGSSITYEGYDAISTTTHPSGSGVGSFRSITGWTQATQILGVASNGGEQQFVTYQPLESDAEFRIPTVQSAYGLTLTIGDDPSLSGYILLKAAGEDRLVRACRLTLPDSSLILYNAYVSFRETPSLNVNQVMTVECTLSLLGKPIRYSS